MLFVPACVVIESLKILICNPPITNDALDHHLKLLDGSRIICECIFFECNFKFVPKGRPWHADGTPQSRIQKEIDFLFTTEWDTAKQDTDARKPKYQAKLAIVK